MKTMFTALTAVLILVTGLAVLGAWSHEGVDLCPGPSQRLPPRSGDEVAALILDGVLDTAIRGGTGYWPRDIARLVNGAPHRVRGRFDTEYHLFASYEMARRFGGRLARIAGYLKESSDARADSFDLRNNEIGIRAAELGLPNPVTGK